MLSKKNFDYIVIGAGTAGGVIAKELTDDRPQDYGMDGLIITEETR